MQKHDNFVFIKSFDSNEYYNINQPYEFSKKVYQRRFGM